MKPVTLYFFLLLVFSSMYGQKSDSISLISELSEDTYKELSLTEWKKFKSFEQRLVDTQTGNLVKEQQLRGYVRDSIQILGVKLMGVKLLNQKKLLHKDIKENPDYYVSLLGELRESGIPQSEYLFLEEKMAYWNQGLLENQLGQSRWFNIGLVVLCICLGFAVFHFRKSARKSPTPELSRQEVTVRDLILQGRSNKEIANELFISLSTVKTHITNLYGKLNVANRQELFQKSTGTST